MLFKFFLIPAILLMASCGTPNGSTWLIKTSTDNISVNAAGKQWNNLNSDKMALYLAQTSPVGSFVSDLGKKTMILHEINNDKYLQSPLLTEMKKVWIRGASFAAYNDSLAVSIRMGVTEIDLLHYTQLLGKVVWYSANTKILIGPARLPDLPWPVAFAFDTMTTGSSVLIHGVAYTLDSCKTSPNTVIMGGVNTDPNLINTFALSNLTRSRVNKKLDSLKMETLRSFSIDSLAVSAYCTSRNSLRKTTVLARWTDGTISAEEFDGIAAFSLLGKAETTLAPDWVFASLRNQAGLSYLERVYSHENPEDYSGILQAADVFAIDHASELLFRDNVTNNVTITDPMLIEEYSRMNSLPLIPETRVFISVQASSEACTEVLASINSGDSLCILNYSGYRKFLLPGNDFLSRPVAKSELPLSIHSTLFSHQESSNTWYGPFETDDGVFVIYQLKQIIPSHAVPFDVLKESIRRRLIMHNEEQRTMEWICELEENHNLQINNKIIGNLPVDPSAWSEL